MSGSIDITKTSISENINTLNLFNLVYYYILEINVRFTQSLNIKILKLYLLIIFAYKQSIYLFYHIRFIN